ncbi:MAG TPA: T9SS type A sorting domain-containing protein [Candidatus Kapabacteria bacterium]|nr:T9SS type A sorting domain-containing protein [Candidatus Kapabacteria bacterium]
MKRMAGLTLIMILVSSVVFAQPTIEWQRCLGGSKDDVRLSATQTQDGGYICLLKTISTDGDLTGTRSHNGDTWIVKLNSTRDIEWQRVIPGGIPYSIKQLSDGSYIILGSRDDTDSIITPVHGSIDVWLVKLSAAGDINWQKCFGGSQEEIPRVIAETKDSSLIFLAQTNSSDGDLGEISSGEVWLVKLDTMGRMKWQRRLDPSLNNNEPYGMDITTENGIIITGSGAPDSVGYGGQDLWVYKLDLMGKPQWLKWYGGSLNDQGNSIIQTTDGGYFVAGHTSSSDGEVFMNHGNGDFWCIKLSVDGTLAWERSVGGSGLESSGSVAEPVWCIQRKDSTDTGIIIAGNSSSRDGDFGNPFPGNTAYAIALAKLSITGKIIWTTLTGSFKNDHCNSLEITSDGGILLGGTVRPDGYVIGSHNGADGWLVKLSNPTATVIPLPDFQSNIVVSPNPATAMVTIKYVALGTNAASIKVINFLGQTVFETTDNNISIGNREMNLDLNQLPSGFYIVKVRCGSETTNQKIVKY